jgi:hypothetical protein
VFALLFTDPLFVDVHPNQSQVPEKYRESYRDMRHGKERPGKPGRASLQLPGMNCKEL